MIWDNGGFPISKLISTTKPRQNPGILSKTKIKGGAQNSHSILKTHSFQPEAACKVVIQVAQLVPAAVFRLPARGCVWSQHAAIGRVAFRTTRFHTPRLQST